jgi:hypothetical protein
MFITEYLLCFVFFENLTKNDFSVRLIFFNHKSDKIFFITFEII